MGWSFGASMVEDDDCDSERIPKKFLGVLTNYTRLRPLSTAREKRLQNGFQQAAEAL